MVIIFFYLFLGIFHEEEEVDKIKVLNEKTDDLIKKLDDINIIDSVCRMESLIKEWQFDNYGVPDEANTNSFLV